MPLYPSKRCKSYTVRQNLDTSNPDNPYSNSYYESDGPAFRWYPYSAMSSKKGDLTIREDLTVKEQPSNKAQEAAAGYKNEA